MKILIYGINYYPELTGIGKYSGEMAAYYAEQGHDVKVLTAPPYYPDWKVAAGYSSRSYLTEQINGVTVHRCPLYVPKKVSTLKRLVHLASFAVSSAFKLFSLTAWKPDVVITVVPSLFCAPASLLYSKITGAKCVLHVQDYEVDAMFGLGMAQKGIVAKLAFGFEKFCLSRFQIVSTISQSMINKAKQKCVESANLVLFPNWSEVERFTNVNDVDVQRVVKNLDIDSNKKVILYSGNIGEKQGLESVIEVAERFSYNEEFIFLIVGQGAGKARLESLAKQKSLSNVVFRPLQPYEDLPALLKLASIHLVVQKKGVADAVLPSKLTNILAVGGHSVITAEQTTELGLLCKEFPGIATCVEPESEDGLYYGIKKAIERRNEYSNEVASKYAKENLEKSAVLNGFLTSIIR